jgi:hypothetical protein
MQVKSILITHHTCYMHCGCSKPAFCKINNHHWTCVCTTITGTAVSDNLLPRSHHYIPRDDYIPRDGASWQHASSHGASQPAIHACMHACIMHVRMGMVIDRWRRKMLTCDDLQTNQIVCGFLALTALWMATIKQYRFKNKYSITSLLWYASQHDVQACR